MIAIHGRYCYVRNGLLIQFSFYKNLLLTFVQVYFNFKNGWSGQTLFDSWSLTFFNILFTALPPILMGVFEKDLLDDVVRKHPALYKDLIKGQGFDSWTIGGWGLSAFAHSIGIYFFLQESWSRDELITNHTSDIWTQGTVPMTAVITVVLLKATLHTRYWTVIPFIGILLSYLGYHGFILLYSTIPLLFSSANYYKVAVMLFETSKWYLQLIFVVTTVMMPDFLIVSYYRNYLNVLRDQLMMNMVNGKVLKEVVPLMQLKSDGGASTSSPRSNHVAIGPSSSFISSATGDDKSHQFQPSGSSSSHLPHLPKPSSSARLPSHSDSTKGVLSINGTSVSVWPESIQAPEATSFDPHFIPSPASRDAGEVEMASTGSVRTLHLDNSAAAGGRNIPTAARRSIDITDEHLCIVCLDEPKNVVLLPCRHMCLCNKCSGAISQCPLCGGRVDAKLSVYC